MLSTYFLLNGEKFKGLDIDLGYDTPIRADIRTKPSSMDRVNWGINAVFLLAQAAYILYYQLGDDLGGGYAMVAIFYGFIGLISAIFPKIKWNKPL